MKWKLYRYIESRQVQSKLWLKSEINAAFRILRRQCAFRQDVH